MLSPCDLLDQEILLGGGKLRHCHLLAHLCFIFFVFSLSCCELYTYMQGMFFFAGNSLNHCQCLLRENQAMLPGNPPLQGQMTPCSGSAGDNAQVTVAPLWAPVSWEEVPVSLATSQSTHGL